MNKDNPVLRTDLLDIPWVGPSIAGDLVELGFDSIASLKHADPEAMYKDLCTRQASYIDPCVLYVFRCAVYFASHDDHDPDLLKWWNWKNRDLDQYARSRMTLVKDP